ncbi:hypothetical protein EVAR_24371_1 [Eumeta japonica]|uniref:Uncharacterized protein n=1 Tax=Eumeta variegata TaxID=151549 RepID=A0A4C1YBQ1_EUMVA|nr:hypothetical protein EVAR_24371_1 [Eumeta japonica]
MSVKLDSPFAYYEMRFRNSLHGRGAVALEQSAGQGNGRQMRAPRYATRRDSLLAGWGLNCWPLSRGDAFRECQGRKPLLPLNFGLDH